jgi:hypothetical protein
MNTTDADILYFTGEDVDPVNDFLGIGSRNKEKKAAKKVAKAEKQLEKGHVRKAEKKLKKATKLQGQVLNAQERLRSAVQAETSIMTGKDAIEQAKQSATTPQTGANPTAYDPVNSMPQSAMSSGGGGGGSLNEDSYPDSQTGSDEPTGALAEEKTLGGVTVTAHKKNNAVLIGAGILVLLLIIFGKKIFKQVKLK